MTALVRSASVRLVGAMDRRRFLRRMATGTFATVAGLAAGGFVNPARAFAYTSYCETTIGTGCPKGCGPSPCCSSLSSGCDCADGSGGCLSSSQKGCCNGKVGDWQGTSCWTCSYTECIGQCKYNVSTTCCDCAITCGSCGQSRCISYSTTMTYAGGCPSGCELPAAPGTVVGVATGYPATSWGVQPQLAQTNETGTQG